MNIGGWWYGSPVDDGFFVQRFGNSYFEGKGFRFSSAFNNPTKNLMTFGNGSQHSQTHISVEVIHNNHSTASLKSGISRGSATIEYYSSTINTSNSTMVFINGGQDGITNLGYLSWSGSTLRYTPSRHSNYDQYMVSVKVFSGGHEITWNA